MRGYATAPFLYKTKKMAVKKTGKKGKDPIGAEKEETSAPSTGDVFSETEEPTEAVENTNEEEVTTVAEEEPSMPMSAVEGLLKRMEERLSNQFNAKLQKMKLGTSKEALESDANYIAELEDDWLETPVVFFAYSINFSIHGDNNRGKSTKPPQGAVRFKPIIRTKRQGKKGPEIISVSSIKVNSRSVRDYLRGHSQFGIAFFENMDSVLNIDSGWAQKLIEANQSIQRLSDQQIIARCRQEGISIGTDIIRMRKALVEGIAEKQIAKQHQVNYGNLEKANIDKNNAQGAERQIIERTIQQ
jgi:hypothetical protein